MEAPVSISDPSGVIDHQLLEALSRLPPSMLTTLRSELGIRSQSDSHSAKISALTEPTVPGTLPGSEPSRDFSVGASVHQMDSSQFRLPSSHPINYSPPQSHYSRSLSWQQEQHPQPHHHLHRHQQAPTYLSPYSDSGGYQKPQLSPQQMAMPQQQQSPPQESRFFPHQGGRTFPGGHQLPRQHQSLYSQQSHHQQQQYYGVLHPNAHQPAQLFQSEYTPRQYHSDRLNHHLSGSGYNHRNSQQSPRNRTSCNAISKSNSRKQMIEPAAVAPRGRDVGMDQAFSAPSRQIFLGNVSASVNEKDLERAFSSFGDIESIKCYSHLRFAFVVFRDINSAILAKETCYNNAPTIRGRMVVVNYGKQPDDSNSFGGHNDPSSGSSINGVDHSACTFPSSSTDSILDSPHQQMGVSASQISSQTASPIFSRSQMSTSSMTNSPVVSAPSGPLSSVIPFGSISSSSMGSLTSFHSQNQFSIPTSNNVSPVMSMRSDVSRNSVDASMSWNSSPSSGSWSSMGSSSTFDPIKPHPASQFAQPHSSLGPSTPLSALEEAQLLAEAMTSSSALDWTHQSAPSAHTAQLQQQQQQHQQYLHAVSNSEMLSNQQLQPQQYSPHPQPPTPIFRTPIATFNGSDSLVQIGETPSTAIAFPTSNSQNQHELFQAQPQQQHNAEQLAANLIKSIDPMAALQLLMRVSANSRDSSTSATSPIGPDISTLNALNAAAAAAALQSSSGFDISQLLSQLHVSTHQSSIDNPSLPSISNHAQAQPHATDVQSCIAPLHSTQLGGDSSPSSSTSSDSSEQAGNHA